MEFTKELAISEHRLMWDYLSKHPGTKKWRYLIKRMGDDNLYELNEEDRERIGEFNCFLCGHSNGDCDEGNCLLIWPGGSCCVGEENDNYPGLYNIWNAAINNEEKSSLAAQIRDLPENPDYE